jgi:hypothetical protein
MHHSRSRESEKTDNACVGADLDQPSQNLKRAEHPKLTNWDCWRRVQSSTSGKRAATTKQQGRSHARGMGLECRGFIMNQGAKQGGMMAPSTCWRINHNARRKRATHSKPGNIGFVRVAGTKQLPANTTLRLIVISNHQPTYDDTVRCSIKLVLVMPAQQTC